MGEKPHSLWTITDGETIPQTVFVATYVGRCETCGFVALGHTTLGGVESEMKRHYDDEHPSVQQKRVTDFMEALEDSLASVKQRGLGGNDAR